MTSQLNEVTQPGISQKPLGWVLAAAAYIIAVYVGLKLEDVFSELTIIWPASGVALALLILTERSKRRLLLGIIYLVGIATYLLDHHSVSTSLLYSLADTVRAGISIWVLTRYCGDQVTFTRTRETLVLLGIIIGVIGVTTFIEARLASTIASVPFLLSWYTWWAADAIGILLLTPFIITWLVNPYNVQAVPLERILEGLSLLMILLVISRAVFGSQALTNNVYIFSYLFFPILIWSGLRFSPRGSTSMLLMLSTLAVWLTLQGYRQESGFMVPVGTDILYRQGLLVAAAISTLFLATIVTELKLGQLALGEAAKRLSTSEARYRSLFEQSHDAVFILNFDGSHIATNKRAADMLGYTVEEVQKLALKDTSAEISKSEDVMVRLIAGEHIPLYERFFRRKDGSLIPVEINAELVRDSDGKPLYVQSVVRDISSRKQAEAQLLERERHSESLLRLARNLERAQTYSEVLTAALEEVKTTIGYQNLWVYLLTEDKQSFIALSASGEISNEVMPGEQFFTLPIGDDFLLKEIATAKEIVIVEDARTDARTNKDIVARLGSRTIVNVPITLFHKHLGTVGTGTFGDEGIRLPTRSEQEFLITLASHLAVALDRIHLLDERLEAEQKLRESEALLMNAQKIAGLAHYILDIRNGSWQGSQLVNEICGVEDGYIKDVNDWVSLIHPDQREAVSLYFMEHVLGKQESFDLEYMVVRLRDHQNRWVHGLGELEFDADGNPLRLIGTIQDVTERKQHEREMESFLKISQSLAGTLELKPMLQNILSAAVRAIPNGEKGTILLLNEKGDLEIRTSVGYEDPRITLSAFPLTDGYAAKAFREMHPLLIADVQADLSVHHNVTIPEMLAVRSAIVAPLIVQEHSIGSIAIDNSSQTDAFNQDNLQLLTTLAASAALAIENARLFDETRQRLAELEALQAISTALRTARTTEEALPIILDETLKAFNTEAGMVVLYDPVEGALSQKVKRGWFEELRRQSVPAGEGIAGTVFVTGQPHVSEEFAKDPLVHLSSRVRTLAGWGGACVPIRTTNEVIGVIFVSVKLPRQISPIQMKMLNAIAEMTGAALQRMKLHEETAHRAEEFSALYQTSMVMSGEHDLSLLLETIVQQATSLLHASGGGMYLYNPSTNDLTMMVATEPTMPIGTRLQLGEGVAGRVSQTRLPMRIDDYSTWQYRSMKYEGTPIRATLEVPMLSGGELIGVLVAHEVGDSERKYSDADERLLTLFASQAAGAIRSARLYDDSVRRIKHLQTLRSIDRAITANMDSNVTLKILLNQALNQANINAISILIFNPNTLRLEHKLGEGFRTRENQKASIRLGEDYAGVVALERRLHSVPDTSELAEGPFKDFLIKESFLSCHFVPMIAKGHVLGVLQVFSRERVNASREWLEFLEALATQAAIAIDNAQLFQDLQHANFELSLAYDATIERWSAALETRQGESETRAKQAVDWTVQLAREAGLEEKVIGHVRRGAILHDIGNMAVPDHILKKPSRLTEEERKLVRGHPEFAHDMLIHVNFLRPALDIPYCHHERWDGGGYPRGLMGEQIPLAARIFAVVDVWNALTSDRPYRKAWTKKKALDYICAQAGKHFDPRLVDLFVEFLGKMDRPKS